ncbi:MAG: RNA polymerase sigma factor [Bryobacterales bacterium]|nr:RNA polymerase sigma factor [Bryobacterales bacterium]
MLYNERRRQVPRTVGRQFRRFRRAEMYRDDAERVINELFTSAYSATVRYAACRCGSLDLAEDLVQEAFGALYARLREGAVIQKPRAWVMKAVQNQICKAWRKAKTRPERAVPRHELEAFALPSDSLGGFVDPDRPHLEGFLPGLSPREREVILLRAQGLKYREIASRLGISSNSVGTLLLRAARKMRAARAETILRSVGAPARSS